MLRLAKLSKYGLICGFKFYFCKPSKTNVKTVATAKTTPKTITSANSVDEIAADTYG
jgi:hypothetical protein